MRVGARSLSIGFIGPHYFCFMQSSSRDLEASSRGFVKADVTPRYKDDVFWRNNKAGSMALTAGVGNYLQIWPSTLKIDRATQPFPKFDGRH